MKIYWSSRSPYVRKVMVVAHEKGCADDLEKIPMTVGALSVNADFHAINPLARIPTLVLDDGGSVYDSSVITEYLDELSARNPLLPAEPRARLAVKVCHALGTGMVDNLLAMRGETARPESEQSPTFLAAGRTKFGHSVDRLESDHVAGLADREIDLGQIAIAVALAYADFRFDQFAWRDGRPRLTAWFETITRRPSFEKTAFVDA